MDELKVPVTGGDLFVARWGGGGPAVLAAHGITASHAAWLAVAEALGGGPDGGPQSAPGSGVTLLAPDLRGRGASAELAGPYGIAAHVDDLVAVLDHLGVERVVAAGHSMGASVAALFAARHPQRVSALLLVDGGLGLPLPEGADPDQVIAAVVGPALQRLGMTFPSLEEYFDYWRQHPTFQEPGAWTPHVERYVRWDLGGEAPALRPRLSREAITQDGRDVLLDDEVRDAPLRARCPVTLLRAPRGMLNQPPGLLPDELVAPYREAMPGLAESMVEDTNHYSIVMGRGAPAVAAKIEQLARASG